IKLKGVLTFCSTDRTEAWHKPLKRDYRKSNKGPQKMDFILKNERRITGWSYYNASLEERGLLPEEWADGEEHEEEDEDYRIDAGNQKTNPQHAEFLGGKRWKGLRTAKVMEEELKLPVFAAETLRLIRWVKLGRQANVRRRAVDVDEAESLHVAGFTALRLVYPTVHDSKQMIQEIVRCTSSWRYWQDSDWIKPRYDTVLIRYDHDEGEHSMVNRKVARIHLLFTTVDSESDEQLNLAFIQLFRTVEPADHWTGMFKVKTLEK